MLDTETKRRIDTARDILVGKVPDPKSQVEQITIALIYKFMDDMDQESLAMGGKASFFSGEFEKYAWTQIFDPRLGGFEMLALYADAITRMSQNPNLPQLFRDIFKNAYLPYRDPETLKLFLKTIHEFQYDHSERLGDAFEYLLSVLGSQGDAGQFRTPRHLIDFMVAVVDPQKNEAILDPACGTAGFLISAYKQILRANTDRTPGDRISPLDKKKLLANFKGYDISPDMVRLSLVNLYLHGFVQPQIYEYDTLTSQERWNDYADVILANPPFMSPKGGIKPHKRFTVQSNRSEVLFVDYIAEHLTPNGRAAIIVPEGIVFQSAGAYKQLRKYLVEQNFLWAVASLPSGVFNPYAGVKTSILFLDRALARKSGRILFVKINADGYDLGAQRRPIDLNDLPGALTLLTGWQRALRAGQADDFDPSPFPGALWVSKSRLAENGEYHLTGERYRDIKQPSQQKFPLVALEELCERVTDHIDPNDFTGDVNYIGLENIESNLGGLTGNISADYTDIKSAKTKFASGDILYGKLRPNLNKVYLAQFSGICSTDIYVFRSKKNVEAKYLNMMLRSKAFNFMVLQGIGGAQLPRVSFDYLKDLEIPLPPLDVQRKIVAEIENHQHIIDGAQQVIAAWKPDIELELEEERKSAGVEAWETIKLGEVCAIQDGTHFSPENGPVGEYKYITAKNIKPYFLDLSTVTYISKETHQKIYERCPVKKGDILYIKDGATAGIAAMNTLDEEFSILSSVAIMKPNEGSLDNGYLLHYLNSETGKNNFLGYVSGVAITRLTLVKLKNVTIPLPPIDIQHTIATRIEAERGMVAANRRLVEIYRARIEKVIERVWEGG